MATLETAQPRARFNARIVWLIALAVFAQEVSWNFYDSQVPASLGKYISSIGAVGFIMGLDNLLGIFLQPLVGAWSDNVRTRLGRRMPFILVSVVVAAIAFALIGFERSLPMLMACVLVYILAMLAGKAPVESLMPDFIVPEHRSKANAIIKIVTTFTVIFAAGLSMLVVDVNIKLAFLIPAVLMILALIVLCATVREQDAYGYQEVLRREAQGLAEDPDRRERTQLIPILAGLFRGADKSRLYLLVSIFLASMAWASLRALLTPYGMQLGLTRGQAGGLTLPGGIAFLLAAYPIALASERYGRRLLVLIGLGVMIAGLAIGFFFQSPLLLRVAVAVITIGWAAVVINAIVLVWNLAATPETTGTYTGIYYLFYYAGAAFGPGIVGTLTDATGWRLFFVNVAVVAALSLILLGTIRTTSRQIS